MANMPDSISVAGIALIGYYEGLRNEVYKDSAGVPTIGIGTTSATGRNIHMGMDPISNETAISWFNNDLKKIYEPAVKNNVTVDLNQDQFDALVSFVYNLGETNFKNSTLLKKLNAGDWWKVPDEIMRWDSAGGKQLRGLTRRRGSEAGRFIRGNTVAKYEREIGPPAADLPSYDILQGEK